MMMGYNHSYPLYDVVGDAGDVQTLKAMGLEV